MHISIIGLPASGKSTLARRLSEKLSIPHIHLDEFWFGAGGHKLRGNDNIDREPIRKYVRDNALKHLKRTFHQRNRHPQISLWDDITFFLELIRRNFVTKPKLLKFVNDYRNKIMRFHSQKEIEKYFLTIKP